MDLYDRLPTPYGLVRLRVAPDHQKIKNVTATFDKTAAHPGFRFFGHVELGKDVTIEDLRAHYHQIVYTDGRPDRPPHGDPGEDLRGSHPATDFVAWYNGHPTTVSTGSTCRRSAVAVVGVGNVAVDVVRILCRTPEELAATDISDDALAALRDEPRARGVSARPARPGAGSLHQPRDPRARRAAGADVTARPDEVELDASVAGGAREERRPRHGRRRSRSCASTRRRPPSRQAAAA